MCFSLFIELVYFKSLCFIFRTKMMLNKLRIESMDEKSRKKRKKKIKFWSSFQQAWSCLILCRLCAIEGRTVRSRSIPHTRPCASPVASFGRFPIRHGCVPHKHDLACLLGIFCCYKLLVSAHYCHVMRV